MVNKTFFVGYYGNFGSDYCILGYSTGRGSQEDIVDQVRDFFTQTIKKLDPYNMLGLYKHGKLNYFAVSILNNKHLYLFLSHEVSYVFKRIVFFAVEITA